MVKQNYILQKFPNISYLGLHFIYYDFLLKDFMEYIWQVFITLREGRNAQFTFPMYLYCM